MVLANSTMMPLGTKAPVFSLPDTGGRTVSLNDFADSPALLVIFMCNHCPYVRHVRSALADLTHQYHAKGVAIVGINSNDVQAYPDDSPEAMRLEMDEAGYVFPYLYDETQEVAKAYSAACTPDFFLFDRDRRLFYRGQMDDSRPSNGKPVTGRNLDAVLAGRPAPENQAPSAGCNIKWKPGNEPDYFH
jgi:peroxiredoxin